MLYLGAIRIADVGSDRQVWMDMGWEDIRLRNDVHNNWSYSVKADLRQVYKTVLPRNLRMYCG